MLFSFCFTSPETIYMPKMQKVTLCVTQKQANFAKSHALRHAFFLVKRKQFLFFVCKLNEEQYTKQSPALLLTLSVNGDRARSC